MKLNGGSSPGSGNLHRIITLMDDELKHFLHKQQVEVDHLGHVAAGSTVEFFDHPRSQLILRPQWVRDFKEVGTVTVSGDSLIDEGIFDGDILIVKRIFDAREIRSGKLVIAYLPTGRSVVKRIHFENGNVILRSANAAYKDMIFGQNEIRIDGIVKELKRVVE